MKKKFLTLLLALITLFSLTGNVVFATDETIDDSVQTETGDNNEDEDNTSEEDVKKEVTLTYNSNGGVINVEPTIVDVNTIINVTDQIPTKTGYKFLGWDTEETATNVVYKAGNEITLTEDTTLYAVYGKSVKILLDANTGTVKQKYVWKYTNNNYDALPTPTKKGYTFVGWYTAKKGGIKVDSTTKITNAKQHTLYARWKLTAYKINYNLNGGTNNKSNPAYFYMTSKNITLKAPYKTGYTFVGWYTNNKYKTKTTTIKKGTTWNVTLYAKWTPNTYTIKFNGNGSTKGKTANTSCKYQSNCTLKGNGFSRSGYTFIGWNTRKDGKGTWYTNKAVVKNLTTKNKGTVTLYAQWKINKYTITYNLNGGTNNKANPSNYYVTTKNITLKAPYKTGYTFAGWYTNNKYKTKTTTIKKGSTGNKVLYAKWTPNTYTIKFVGNGATKGKTANTSCKYQSNCTLKGNGFSKTGYYFAGWNTKKDGTGTWYKNKAVVKNLTTKNKANITLYAQWKLTPYKITYNLNGGVNSEKNPATYYYTSSNIYLSTPTKEHYTFAGWYADAKYKTKVTTIKKGSLGNKVLYAKWTAKQYKITYVLDGGVNSKYNPSTFNVGTKTIAFSRPSKNGYTFDGWYLDSEFTNKITQLPQGSYGNQTLYAKWNINTYNITYNLNGGTNSENNPATYQATTPTINLENPTNKGYAFAGWYADAKYKTKVTKIAAGSTGDKVLYAKWTIATYKITYNLDGGTNATSNPISFKVTTPTILLSNPTKVGNTFDGWYLDSDYTIPFVSIEQGTAENVTVYAKWIPNTFTVSFNDNNSSAGSLVPDMVCTYGSDCILPEATYEKSGYIFGGWNTLQNNSGKVYTEGYNIKNYTSVDGAHITFYATWTIEAPSFTIENVKYYETKLTITEVANASGYEIYRKDPKSSAYKLIKDLSSGLTYEDEDLTQLTSYSYRVRAYYTNEYGIKVYSDYTDITGWRTAEKPKIAGRVTNTLYKSSYYGYVKIVNNGTKPLYILNFVTVSPFSNASSSSAYDTRYNKLGYVSLDGGYQTTFYFDMDTRRYFSDGAHVGIMFKYDGCSYFAVVYEDGTGTFL